MEIQIILPLVISLLITSVFTFTALCCSDKYLDKNSPKNKYRFTDKISNARLYHAG